MDLRFKVVIIVFVVIAILYSIYFVMTYMGKKKETFVDTFEEDDVEHYEDLSKPNPSTKVNPEAKYDQRILILDDIEKLHISSKDVKGKLMEVLFDEDVLKQISSLSSAGRFDFIQKKYKELEQPVVSESTLVETSKDAPNTSKIPKPSLDGEKKDKPPHKDEFEEHPAELMKKTQDALNHLQYVENGLNDIQAYAKSFKIPFKEPMLPPPPKDHIASPIQDVKDLIEGFENVQSFAPFAAL
jgi:hypoxanthine phosphoribosyltransferase